MELYDFEMDPKEGAFTTKIQCPNGIHDEGDVCLALVKLVRHPTFTRDKIAIYECRTCKKRYLGVGS